MTDLQGTPRDNVPARETSPGEGPPDTMREIGSAAGITDEVLSMSPPRIPVGNAPDADACQTIQVSAQTHSPADAKPATLYEETTSEPAPSLAETTTGDADELTESETGSCPRPPLPELAPEVASATALPPMTEHGAAEQDPSESAEEHSGESCPDAPTAQDPQAPIVTGFSPETHEPATTSGGPIRRFVRNHPRWTVALLLSGCAALLPFVEAGVQPESKPVEAVPTQASATIKPVIAEVTPMPEAGEGTPVGASFWPDDLNATPAVEAPAPFRESPVMHAVTSQPAGTPSYVQPAGHSDVAPARPIILGAQLTGTIEFDEEPPTVSPMTNPESRRTVSRFGE